MQEIPPTLAACGNIKRNISWQNVSQNLNSIETNGYMRPVSSAQWNKIPLRCSRFTAFSHTLKQVRPPCQDECPSDITVQPWKHDTQLAWNTRIGWLLATTPKLISARKRKAESLPLNQYMETHLRPIWPDKRVLLRTCVPSYWNHGVSNNTVWPRLIPQGDLDTPSHLRVSFPIMRHSPKPCAKWWLQTSNLQRGKLRIGYKVLGSPPTDPSKFTYTQIIWKPSPEKRHEQHISY